VLRTRRRRTGKLPAGGSAVSTDVPERSTGLSPVGALTDSDSLINLRPPVGKDHPARTAAGYGAFLSEKSVLWEENTSRKLL
jgi:hypothetical protein